MDLHLSRTAFKEKDSRFDTCKINFKAVYMATHSPSKMRWVTPGILRCLKVILMAKCLARQAKPFRGISQGTMRKWLKRIRCQLTWKGRANIPSGPPVVKGDVDESGSVWLSINVTLPPPSQSTCPTNSSVEGHGGRGQGSRYDSRRSIWPSLNWGFNMQVREL